MSAGICHTMAVMRAIALALLGGAGMVSAVGYWDMGNTTDLTIDLLNLRTWPWGSTWVACNRSQLLLDRHLAHPSRYPHDKNNFWLCGSHPPFTDQANTIKY